MRRVLALASAIVAVLGLLPALASAAEPTTAATASSTLQPELDQRLADAPSGDELLVFVHAEDVGTASGAIDAAGLTPGATFDAVGIATGWGTPAEIHNVADEPGVTYVEGDRPISFFSSTSHEATRGAEVLSGLTDANGAPIDGRGVSIAVVDSGVDGNHPAFVRADGTSKVVRNVKSVCPFVAPTEPSENHVLNNCFVDVAGNDSDTTSVGGHGTHVAGIAAGVQDTAGGGQNVHGAAPGADLVGVSVGAAVSVYGGAQGLNWVLTHHEDPCAGNLLVTRPATCAPIRVVNASWGPAGGGEFDPNSGIAKIQDALAAEGVVVVWAAGNDGGDGSSNVVNPPAQSPTGGILSVANYDDGNTGTRNGSVAPSSSRGEDGRPGTYPDLAAPGTDILQACTYVLAICRSSGDLRYLWYAEISGTSMAAPHVAGIVAQLFQADASLTPAQVEDVLEDNAYEFGDGAPYESDPRNADGETSYDKGHGLVDAYAAVSEVLGS